MSLQTSFSTETDLHDDSDEEKDFKRDLLLACVLGWRICLCNQVFQL